MPRAASHAPNSNPKPQTRNLARIERYVFDSRKISEEFGLVGGWDSSTTLRVGSYCLGNGLN